MENKKTQAIVMAAVLAVVAIIMTPIVIDATVDVVGHANIDDFTGLEAVTKLVPLLFLVAVVFGAIFFGVKAAKGGSPPSK